MTTRLRRGVDWHSWVWKAGKTWPIPGAIFHWAEAEKPKERPTETGKWVRVKFVEMKVKEEAMIPLDERCAARVKAIQLSGEQRCTRNGKFKRALFSNGTRQWFLLCGQHKKAVWKNIHPTAKPIRESPSPAGEEKK